MNVGGIPFWPRNASTTAGAVDELFLSELGLVVLVLVFVFAMMLIFIVRYRRGSPAERGHRVAKTWRWEIAWTAATLIGFLGLFAWGAEDYFFLYQPPHADIEVFVVGKQWMWKIEHPGGQREIDALHVPLGKTVRLVLASEDVIHDFFVPAFRIKHDVVPGTYEIEWFKATRLGTFRIECAQYCGTGHAAMIGKVIVMTPADYARWLDDQGVHESLAEQGEALFRSYGCSGCHTPGSAVHAPSLYGVFGSLVHLESGETVRADERYIRDSITLPHSQIVAGYGPIMPDFSGEISEDNLVKLVAYIESLAQNRSSQP